VLSTFPIRAGGNLIMRGEEFEGLGVCNRLYITILCPLSALAFVSEGEVSLLPVPGAGWEVKIRREQQFHREARFWPSEMDCKSGRREDHHEISRKEFIYAMDTKSTRKSRLKSAGAQAPSKAMTLVELLVVVAIIGILASLLLSALSKSKSVALQTQCLGQVKQLALALQMYTQDNGDFMTWPNWGVNFQGWLYTRTDGRPPQPSSPPEAVYAGGTLWPYVKEAKIYWCPVDYTNTPSFREREEKLSSYILNGAIMGYYLIPTESRTHKLSAMNSSAYVTWEPNDQPPYDAAHVFNDGASYPREDEGPSQRHGTGCNVSSFDGHAQFLSYAVFHQDQSDKPGLLWCDPDTADGSGGMLGRGCELWK